MHKSTKLRDSIKVAEVNWLILALLDAFFAALRVGDVFKVAAVDRSSLFFVIVLSFAVLGGGSEFKDSYRRCSNTSLDH